MTIKIPTPQDIIKKRLGKLYRGSDRRKSPRISIQELNEFGAEALRKRLPEIRRKVDRRPTISKVLDVIDLPRNVIANAIASLAKVDVSQKERAALGVPRVWMSDVLKKLGVKNRVVRAIGGFGLDVAIDPLTYPLKGATIGAKVAQHIPRILKGGTKIVQAAAQTGKYTPELVKAIGGAKRAARIARVAKAVAKVKGAKAVAKRLADKRGGLLYRQIVKGAERGRPAALEFLKKHGQKGRPLFGLPFTEIAGPTLKVGARARKYKALTDPAAFAELAKRTKVLQAKRGALVARQAIAARRTAAPGEDILAGLKRKFEVLPKGEAAIRRAILRKGPKAKKAISAAKKARQRAAQAVEKAKSELTRFKTSPEAPGIIQEKMRVVMGAPRLTGEAAQKAGLARRAIELGKAAKRARLGPGVSKIHQQMVSARIKHDVGARILGAKAGATLKKQLDPIIDRLARTPSVQQMIGGPDDVKRYILALAEAGPEGRSLMRYGEGAQDAIHQMYATAQKAGLLQDKPLQTVLTQYADDLAKMATKAKKRGIPLGEIEDYAPRILTKEAARAERAHITTPRPGKLLPGGRVALPEAAHLPRTKMLTFSKKGLKPVQELSSNKDEIGALLKKGYKETGSRSISAAQWNKMSLEGRPPAGVVGPAFKGRMLEEDLPMAMGRRVGHAERAHAAADVAETVQPYGVRVKQAIAEKRPEYAHMAKPKKPVSPDHPFAGMAKAGTLDKYYPVQIADQLDNLMKVWDNGPAIESLLHASDVTLGFWKGMQLYHPAYVIRNVFQNFFGGLMAGANPLEVARRTFAPETYAIRKAIQTVNPALLRGKFLRLRSGDLPLERLFETARRYNMVGASRAMAEGGQLHRKVANRALGIVFRGNTLMEDHQRIATWFHFMDRGMDAKDAAIRVLYAMPDLTDLSLWERKVFRRIFPFASWMRRNGALQIFHFLPRKPAYMAMLPKFKNFAEGFMVKDKVPEEFRPAWMREQMAVQVTGGREGGQTFLPMNWLPFEEMYQVMSAAIAPGDLARRGISSMRPGIRFPIEVATGINIFKQTPYEKGGEITMAELLKAFPQAIMGNSGTQMDTLVALRPFREWMPGGRVAQMPTPAAKVGRAVLGGAFQPVSLARGRQAEAYRLRQLSLQLRQQINRARSAADEPEAQQLMRKWIQTIKRLHEIGGPGVAKSTQAVLEEGGVRSAMAG